MLVFCPVIAAAGPWAREKGTSFMSLSITASNPADALGETPDLFGSFYMERGLGRELTLGFDTGLDQDMDYTSLIFLRKPVGPAESPHRFALRLGGGTSLSGGVTDYVAMAGGAWGRGFETRFGSAWAVLDLSMQYRINAQESVAKADLTLGVKPSDRTKIMVQFQSGDYPGSKPFLRVVPSVARKFGERTHIELGAQIGLSGEDRVGVKLGTWLEF